MNRVTLIGHLGADPDLKKTPGGDSICTFAMATNERWLDKATGDWKQSTEWHRITIFGKLADTVAKTLCKGSEVLIEGKLKTRRYNKGDQTHYSTEIHAREVHAIGRMASAERDDPPDGVRKDEEDPGYTFDPEDPF